MISNSLDEIKDYFVSEIKERELMSKRPSKLLILTTLINLYFLLSATSGSISIASFVAVIGAPVAITSAILRLIFLQEL